MTSLPELKSKFRKVFKAENHSAFSLLVFVQPHLLMSTRCASDGIQVGIDFETWALLKLFREKKLEETSD